MRKQNLKIGLVCYFDYKLVEKFAYTSNDDGFLFDRPCLILDVDVNNFLFTPLFSAPSNKRILIPLGIKKNFEDNRKSFIDPRAEYVAEVKYFELLTAKELSTEGRFIDSVEFIEKVKDIMSAMNGKFRKINS